jgi:hypothetical protein
VRGHSPTALSHVMLNQWEVAPAEREGGELPWLFTDASGRLAGYTIVDATSPVHGNRIVAEGHRQWSGREEKWHIFLKEMSAVLFGLQHLAATVVSTALRVVLVTDNSAVRCALENWMTGTGVARNLLTSIRDFVEARNWELEAVGVPSADNPADDPSRGRHSTDERVGLGVTAVQKFRQGQRSANAPDFWGGGGGKRTRHDPMREEQEDEGYDEPVE